MEPLIIKPTPTSLDVQLDAQSGKLLFSGRSVSEHSIEFFKPIMDWLEQYAKVPAAKTECICRLEYFNSAAKKSLVELFKLIHSIHKKGHTVSVSWHYDAGDDGMKELGEEYANMFNMKFDIFQG